MSTYGSKLSPSRQLRIPHGIKATRQTVVVTNNPSTVDQNQQLLVRFPNLGPHDVIVPGSSKLAFTVGLTSTDANRTVVQNLGRAIVKKLIVRVSGNEVFSVDDSDVFRCYTDLWKTAQERENAAYQGIDTSANRNATKLRVGAGDGNAAIVPDAAVNTAFGNRFYIPLDFELLESHMPFHQAGLGDRLEYELTFNDYSRVVVATGDAAATYTVDGISLEFDVVSNEELARRVRMQYCSRIAILYDRVLRHRKIVANKSDSLWNINLNVPMRSCKGILLLFEDAAAQAAFARNTESFYNPKITKVEVTVEGVPNQLYSQGMRALDQWGEAMRYFGGSHETDMDEAALRAHKELNLADVSLPNYLTTKFGLWLDLRSTDDPTLHGSGRRIENASEGITLQISKTIEAAGALNIYL